MFDVFKWIAGTYYDYLKELLSLISGSTWNKVLHDGMLFESAGLSGGSADFLLLLL
jgi:hypothetical protein